MPQVILSKKFHEQRWQYSTNDDKLVAPRSTYLRDGEIELVQKASFIHQIDHIWQSLAGPAWGVAGRDGQWTKEPHWL